MEELVEAAPVSEAPVQDAAPAAAPEVEQPAVDTTDADLRAIWDKHNPARDETGRFASRTPAVEAEPPAEEISGQTPEPEATEPAKPAIDAPHSWPAEMKQRWASLPPEAQEYIARRESEVHQQITRMGQQVKGFEPVARLVEQQKGTFERLGMTPEQGLGLLFQAQRALEENPVAAIHKLAADFGVDLQALYGQAQNGGSQPQVVALQTEIANLKRQIADTSRIVLSRDEREAAERATAAEKQVADFVEKHPDFPDLEADIISLLPMIRSQEKGSGGQKSGLDQFQIDRWGKACAKVD